MLLNLVWRISSTSQCAMRLVGYSADEVMGKWLRQETFHSQHMILFWTKTSFDFALLKGCSLVQEFITDDFKIAVQTVLDRALRGEETENFDFPLITKGGSRIEILLNATTRRDEQGNIIGVVGIGQDVRLRLLMCKNHYSNFHIWHFDHTAVLLFLLDYF